MTAHIRLEYVVSVEVAIKPGQDVLQVERHVRDGLLSLKRPERKVILCGKDEEAFRISYLSAKSQGAMVVDPEDEEDDDILV